MGFSLDPDLRSLRLGQTANNLTCPKCGGGVNRDRSFSCTRVEAGFVYVCFRAKCGYRGFTRAIGVPDDGTPLRGSDRGYTPTKPKPFTGETTEPPEYVSAMLLERYGITGDSIRKLGIRWSSSFRDSGPGRLLVPIVRLDGKPDGFVARAIDGSQPRSLTYCDSQRGAPLSWFLTDSEELYVVEDQYSAIRLWQEGVSAVALLGTTFNHERAVEVGAGGKSPVYMALDKDATNKAIDYVSRFRYVIPSLTVKPLDRDVKDLNATELKEFLK